MQKFRKQLNSVKPIRKWSWLMTSLFLMTNLTASCAFWPFSEDEEGVINSSDTQPGKVAEKTDQEAAIRTPQSYRQLSKTPINESSVKEMGALNAGMTSDADNNLGVSGDTPSETVPEAGFISKITKTLTFQDKNAADQESLQKARMMARLNDLETKVNEQSQKIRVLEKAVKLGIIPEEMKTKNNHSEQKLLADYAGEDEDLETPTQKSQKKLDSRKGELKKDMAEANALFTKGEYGKAFVAFQKIDQKYSEVDKQGESLFWMGKCWFSLKEYQTAKQYFKDMIRSNPASTRVGQAKVLIAQSELKLGLNEEALATLRDIIRDHPEGNSSDEARKILSQLKDSL